MSSRPFNTAEWVSECPPDYDTVPGWMAKNEPGVLKDVYEQQGGDGSRTHLALHPERRKAAYEGFMESVIVKPPAALLRECAGILAYPVGILNKVFAKDTYQTP